MYEIDNTGFPIPPAALRKSWETDFEGDALPDWITLDPTQTGAAVAASTTDPGGVLLTSLSGTGNQARLNGPTFDLSTPVATQMRISFTPTSGSRMEIGFQGAASGAFMYIQHGSLKLGVSDDPADPDALTLSDAIAPIVIYGKRHHLFLRVTPEDLTLTVGETCEGEVGDAWTHVPFDAEAFGLGSVTPHIRVVGAASDIGSIDIHQLAIDRWWR